MRPRGAGTSRRATALVAVMALLLVVGGLGAVLISQSGGSRRKFQAITHHVQRDLVLDAAFVHAFHALKAIPVDGANPLEPESLPVVSGELGGTRYRVELRALPEKKLVRIHALVGEPVALEGDAVAYLKVEELPDEGVIRQAWSLRYFGPDSPEENDL